MSESVRVYAPATVANLGPGFDILGMAISEPGDIVTARLSQARGVKIETITGDQGKLSLDPAKNTAGVAAQIVLDTIDPGQGVRLDLEKGLPLASGLGSSAASAVAGAVAVNELFGCPLKPLDLIPALLEAEALVSGYHLDNVAPCLLGGIVLVAGVTAADVYELPVGPVIGEQAWFVLCTPDLELPTAESRRVLPELVPFEQLVAQTGAVARLVRSIYADDVFAFGKAMYDEAVVHRARAGLIPQFSQVGGLSDDCGSLALIISGGGPTLGALFDVYEKAMMFENRVRLLPMTTRISQVCRTGARVLD